MVSKPFESTQDFIVHNALAGLKMESNNLSVVSAYFLLTAQVQIERAGAQLSSVLHREANKIKIIMRSQGRLISNEF